jgi:hypothetical protein
VEAHRQEGRKVEDGIRAGLSASAAPAAPAAPSPGDALSIEMRKFAFVTSGGFTLIFCAAPFVLKHRLHLWPLGLSLILIALAFAAPKTLVPVRKAWMAFGHALGWVNSRIILSVVFYVIFFPIALLRRLAKSGTIVNVLKFDREAPSYRIKSEERPREQMEKPF